MKKILFLLLFTSIILLPVSAEEADGQSWNNIMNNYDPMGFRKPVTQGEFDQAIDTVQNINKKKGKKNKNPQEMKNKDVFGATKSMFKSEEQLLRLVFSTYYKDVIITPGFYKIKPTKEGREVFLKITQGKDLIAKIKAGLVQPMFCENEISCLKTEIIKNKYLKIYYKDFDKGYIGYLFIMPE